jgi:ribosome-associated toxin RatA of RatAB toxin-antitoxin module
MGRVHRIEQAAVVPYEACALYGLVADVESYPDFVPGCTGARVVRLDDHAIDASLQVAKGPFKHWFTTRNTLHPCERIDLSLVDGPFRALEGGWHFAPAAGGGSRIRLELEFEFSGPVLGRLLAPAFGDIARRMVDAFVARAAAVHGSRSG